MKEFSPKETKETILADLKEAVEADAVVSNEVFDSLKLDKPLVNFYIDSSNASNVSKMATTVISSLTVFISVSDKDYERGNEALDIITKQVLKLKTKKGYKWLGADYENYVDKFKTYTTMIRFEYEEKCLK